MVDHEEKLAVLLSEIAHGNTTARKNRKRKYSDIGFNNKNFFPER